MTPEVTSCLLREVWRWGVLLETKVVLLETTFEDLSCGDRHPFGGGNIVLHVPEKGLIKASLCVFAQLYSAGFHVCCRAES